MEQDWKIFSGNVTLQLDATTGSLSRLEITGDKMCTWTVHPGEVTVRDDCLEKTFTPRELERVNLTHKADTLSIRKVFRGAPWVLEESYHVEDDAIAWNAIVTLEAGAFRSCAVTYRIPWQQPIYPANFWTARDKMPSAPHRFGVNPRDWTL